MKCSTCGGCAKKITARLEKVADIEKIVREIIIPELEKYSLAEDYNSNKLKVHYKNNYEVPFNYRQDIDFESNAIFSERNLGLPGVRIEQKPVRQYVYGALGAHFLGYVGMPNNLDKLPDIRQCWRVGCGWRTGRRQAGGDGQPLFERKAQFKTWQRGAVGDRERRRDLARRVRIEHQVVRCAALVVAGDVARIGVQKKQVQSDRLGTCAA